MSEISSISSIYTTITRDILDKDITQKYRRKFHSSRIKYTHNGVSTYNLEHNSSIKLLIAGDVEPNPGPDISDDSTQYVPNKLDLPQTGLRIGFWNINKLTDSKFQQIKPLLIAQRVDILFLIETFLKSHTRDSVYAVQGYEIYRKDRAGKTKGGGILAYINTKLKVSRATKLEQTDIETLWLNVYPFNSNRSQLLGCVYRPPSTNTEMDSRFEKIFEMAYLMKKETYIMGDFNIDLLKAKSKQQTYQISSNHAF